jgi:broad specificity phosphatase PhoE
MKSSISRVATALLIILINDGNYLKLSIAAAWSPRIIRGRRTRSPLIALPLSVAVVPAPDGNQVVQPSFWNDASVSLDSFQQEVVVDSMPPPLPSTLKHTYYLLRHGQSTSNVANVISSDWNSLAYTERHGLTEVGYEQAFYNSAASLVSLVVEQVRQHQPSGKDHALIMVSSPFARARQTAQACMEGIQATPSLVHELTQSAVRIIVSPPDVRTGKDSAPLVMYHDGLVERYFGKLDDEALETYAYVWPLDRFNVSHTAFNVESVAAVATRVRQVILDVEGNLEAQIRSLSPAVTAAGRDTHYHVVLVSHADVLQITQLYAANANNVGAFSSYRFQNGEVRVMDQLVSSLPPPVPLTPPFRQTRTFTD